MRVGRHVQASACPRRGFTLIELLVVITIIGVLVGMLLPAVNAARESARRSSCSNNMKQIGLGILNFESSYKKLPTGGEGTFVGNDSSGNVVRSGGFSTQGTFVYLLPYIEQGDLYNAMDLSKSPRDVNAGHLPTGITCTINGTTCGGNVWAATHHIPTYVCPSNPFGAPNVRDPLGFGGLDYFATCYTDINPSTGIRDKTTRMDGALCVDFSGVPATAAGKASADSKSRTGVPLSAVADGASNTIAVIEDAGRVSIMSNTSGLVPYKTMSRYADALASGVTLLTGDITGTGDTDTATVFTAQTNHAVWRWCDADAGGSGVSGPFGPTMEGGTSTQDYATNPWKVISQHNFPIGGDDPTGIGNGVNGCSWTKNNCGANDEPFSFHAGGCNVVMMDGSVKFLSDALDPITLRRLVTRAESIPIDKDLP